MGLIALALLQLALPPKTVLPPDSALAPRRAREPMVAAIPAYPAFLQSGLFSPDRAAANGDAGGSLDENAALGVIMTGPAAAALIKAPGSPARLIRVGQSIGEWRLVHIARDVLVFESGGHRRTVTVGAPAAPIAVPSTPAPQGAETDQ